jgi:serine/threonine protein kinase
MRSLLASLDRVREDDRFDRLGGAVRAFEEQWRRGEGEPALERHWAEHDPRGTTSVLAALVKADLRCRFARGDRPAVQDYFERFPALRAEKDRVVSLIYEEFCLCEEYGARPDPDSFCRRYPSWRDSLASQLKYHQLLSRVVGPTVATPRFPEPGEHFEEFAIDSVLGQGGAARVYRARNSRLGGREVALKISADRGQEPSIMGRLDHAHIIPVHNVVVQPETQLRGLIMPYCPGLPLDEVIRRVDPSRRPSAARVLWEVVAAAPRDHQGLPARTGWDDFPMRGSYAQGVAWIIAALADAVAHAHAHEIQHRDIKPANVLMTRQNGPQLLDFNLAHDPHAAEQAEAALRGGTLPYMAPEQLEAFLDPDQWLSVGPAADLYSLGLVMYELLTGDTPAVPDQSLPLPRAIRALLDRRLDLQFAPRQSNPVIPHALEAITRCCLAYSPADRYPSAEALADDLRRFLNHRPLQTAVNRSRQERFENWTRRNWLRLGVAGIALAANAAGAGWWIPRMSPVEHQSEFLAAQAAFENQDPRAAVNHLVPLAARFPDSRLVRIHLGDALGLAGDVHAAARAFCELPISDDDLRECSRRSPATADRLASLGITLSDYKKSRVPYPKVAHRALTGAILLGLKNPDVLSHAALVDEQLKRYAQALEGFTTCIPQIEAEKPLNLSRLIKLYHSRARVAFRLADEWVSSGRGDLERTRILLDTALADLNAAKGKLNSKDVVRINLNNSLRAERELCLGRLEISNHRRAEALAHSLYADQLISQLPNNDDADRELERLNTELGELRKSIASLPADHSVAAR